MPYYDARKKGREKTPLHPPTKRNSFPLGNWLTCINYMMSDDHRTRGEYKNLPLPPTKRTGGYIEECVFKNFKTFRIQGSKC